MLTPRFLILIFITQVILVNAQTLTQTVRGKVVDQVTQMALPGATVQILNTDPIIGAVTDAEGEFKIQKLPVGNYALRISFIGYKDFVLPNIIVNSGKETVLTIAIEEELLQMEEVVVVANEKDRTINEMVLVSARTFSVEETRKFAAAINDPARMASSFAGVISTDDGNNNISIRGNSPNGLLWRMEGVDIPNPNHFVNPGTSGGGISILSSQLLTNSDFMTGAFTAEYGNALSGVFDLSLRRGNNEKSEFTFQAGFLGTDLAAEGPIAKNYKGSYLVNYRYSTLSLLSKIGVPLGDFVTNFQDLSLNIYLPTGNNSSLSVFGFGGLSNQNKSAEQDSLTWSSEIDRYSTTYFSNTGALGLKHTLFLNDNSYLQCAVVFSGNEIGDDIYKLDDQYANVSWFYDNFSNSKITFSSILTTKLSARYSIRTGIYLNQLNYNLKQRSFDQEADQMITDINSKGGTQSIQAFSQVNIRATDRLTLNAGFHYLHLLLNNSFSIEPRLSASYSLSQSQRINIGYGLHSQVQPLGTYFGEYEDNGQIFHPNKNLGLSKSHHFVIGYDQSLNPYLRMKIESYYQYLFNIPVKPGVAETYSILNQQWTYMIDPLVNEGFGKNYGLEFTLEQFTVNNMYFLISTSVYNSLYKTQENKWRNTRYNGNVNIAFTAGKELFLSKDRVLGLNFRSILSGGLRTTPINLEASVEKGETVFYEERAFEEQNPAYFRTDIRLSLKKNKPKSTHTLSLDIQNVTNRKNSYGKYFEPITGTITTAYQTPLIPVLSYKIEF